MTQGVRAAVAKEMMATVSWFVYIVQCADYSLYTGITSDVERRIEEHNQGLGGAYTRTRRPVRLLHTEEYRSRSEALKRERYLKHLPRSKKLALIHSGSTN